MRIAILILCHKNPSQINALLNILKNPSITFFLHIDRKSSIKNEITKRDDVVILSDNKRVDVQWGKISQIQATLNLLNSASSDDDYDFFWLCSGQDFPIKSCDYILKWFENNADNDFVNLMPSKNTGLKSENNYDKRNAIYFPNWILGKEIHKRIIRRFYTEITGGYNQTYNCVRRKPVGGMRFYFGSQWICLTRRTVDWITIYLNKNPEYFQFFENCNCPDESFFQTLVMNSPYASLRKDYLHFIDWAGQKNHPKVLTIDDYHRLIESEKLMARKFDFDVDQQIIKELVTHLRQCNANDTCIQA